MARNASVPPRSGEIPVPAAGNQSTSKSDFKRPTFWVSVITLIVISLYTWFAHGQVEETQTANSIARKALSEANKPYVMFTGLVPQYLSDNNGRHFHVSVSWKNFGNSPAQSMIASLCDPIIRDDLVAPVFDCKLSDTKAPATILGPKQDTTVLGPVIKESDFEATKDEKKTIYIFGYVEYEDYIATDPFGNPEQRTTRFCERIIKPQITITTPGTPNAPGTTTVVNPPPGAPITAIASLGCPGTFTCMDETCRPLKK